MFYFWTESEIKTVFLVIPKTVMLLLKQEDSTDLNSFIMINLDTTGDNTSRDSFTY